MLMIFEVKGIISKLILLQPPPTNEYLVSYIVVRERRSAAILN